MYLIRTAPVYRNTVWCEEFDETIRKCLQEILNVDMEGSIWAQSSLPVHLGGLGIRRVSEVALPAYLSSMFVQPPLALRQWSRQRFMVK